MLLALPIAARARSMSLAAAPDTSTAASASPDTGRLVIEAPADWPAPRAVRLVPDSLRFGAEGALQLDFTTRPSGFVADSLQIAAPWVEVPEPWRPQRLSGGSPADASWRVELPLRVYRVGPLKVEWQSGREPVAVAAAPIAFVAGRTAPGARPAAVRPPRGIGWNPLLLLALLLLAVVASGVAMRLVARRRRRAWNPHDRPLASPAWLAAAESLRSLVEEDLPGRGEGRRHLDRLAGVVRRYLAARFGLPALELAAAELPVAGSFRGFATREIAPFTNLLEEIDSVRFAPQPVVGSVCRRLTGAAVAAIARRRVVPRWTPITPQRRQAGERAWAWLIDRFPPDADRAAVGGAGRRSERS
jgi:hypothetical protein